MSAQADGAAPSLLHLVGGVRLRGAEWVRIRVPPGGGFVMPSGDHFTAHYMIRGQLRMLLDHDEPQLLGCGETAILPRGSHHSLRQDGNIVPTRLDCFDVATRSDIPRTIDLGPIRDDEAAIVLSGRLHFDWPSGLPAPQSLPSVLLGTRSILDQPVMTESAARALETVSLQPGAEICLSRFTELLLARDLIDLLLLDPALFLSTDGLKAAMARAIDIVRMKPAYPWTVERLARSVGMSRTIFASAFKDIYDRGPMTVVGEKRMELAAKFLREGDARIKVIASKVGYNSDTAFMRRFVAQFGQTPSEYRRMHQLPPAGSMEPSASSARMQA